MFGIAKDLRIFRRSKFKRFVVTSIYLLKMSIWALSWGIYFVKEVTEEVLIIRV